LRRRRGPGGTLSAFRPHAGGALGNLERGAKKIKKKEVQKKLPEKRKIMKQKEGGNGNLPGRNQHFPLPVALGCDHLLGNSFRPGALGGRSVTRTGFRCRSLLLLAPGGEFIQELLANHRLQRSGVLHNWRVGAGRREVCRKTKYEVPEE
jgi:hypothetical protein